MREPYICPYCHHRSTRRWNLDVHIKRRHGGYLVGRSLGQHMANNSPLYNQSVHVGHATVADSIDNTLHPTFLPQGAVLGTTNPIYPPADVPPANPMNIPMQIMDNQRYETGLSQGVILKIQELKRLVNKYPQFHTIDADEIVKWAIYCSSNRDNKFLDDMLDQLQTIDSLAKY